MAISDRIESIEEHLRDDYSVLEVAGADLTNVNKNILNLKPTWKERLLYFMNNGTDVVWNNWDKVTGEGETITLNDTVNTTMAIDLKGNTSQEGTPTPESPQDIHVVSGDNSINIVGTNLYNTNDITNSSISVDNEGYITISLDNSSGSSTIINNFSTSLNSLIKPSTSYSVILEVKSVSGTGRITLNETSTATQFLGVTSRTFESISSNSVYINVISTRSDFSSANKQFNSYVYCTAGEAGTIKFRVSILSNTSITANDFVYQPYQSASYPISLGNMCKDFILGYVDIDGTIHSSTIWITTKDYITIEPNTSYTFKANSPSTRCLIGEYDTNKTFISPRQEIVLGNTYTTTNNAKYIKFSIYDGSTNIEMYKTGTTPIELCKIGDYQDSIKKSTGKNLFDKDNPTIPNADMSYGQIISKNDTNCWFFEVDTNKTYTLTKQSYNYGYIGYSNTKPVIGTNLSNRSSIANETTITINPTDKYLCIFISKSDNLDIIQLEEGTATSYEPYGTDWYVKKEIGKVVLDGSETWNTSGSSYYTSILQNLIAETQATSQQIGYSNYFKVVGFNYQNANNLWFHPNKNLQVLNTNYPTLNDWTIWLSTNKPVLYYPMATPTYETITDSTLLSQLNALAKSYNSQTNITQVNNDSPFIINATALREMS